MERLDLYFDRYEKTGESINRGEDISSGSNALMVFSCIFNAAGQILLQQRSYDKATWAGYWDVSAAGAVRAGETSLAAVIRETEEEIGLRLPADSFQKILSIYYDRFIHDIYVAEADLAIEDLHLQKEEVACVCWATEEETVELIAQGKFIPVEKEFMQLVFRMRKKKGILASEE